jgi:cytochrome c biogenesis protein CcmG/thiol:disulfide interchange protein DsbE
MSTISDQVDGEGPVRRRPRPIFLLVGVVIAAILAVVLYALGTTTGSGTTRLGAGRPVPHFSLPALGAGGKVGVPEDGGAAGRPAILLFFASWCSPCRKEVPLLAGTYRHEQQLHSRLAEVAVIGVDANDPTSSALAFVRSSGVTFPVGADVDFTVTEGLFGFAGLPESVFVEGNGTIAGIHYGPLSEKGFVSWERRLAGTA